MWRRVCRRITMTIQSCMLKCPLLTQMGFWACGLPDEPVWWSQIRRVRQAKRVGKQSTDRLSKPEAHPHLSPVDLTENNSTCSMLTAGHRSMWCTGLQIWHIVDSDLLTQNNTKAFVVYCGTFLGNFELHLVDPYTLCHKRRPARSYRRPR